MSLTRTRRWLLLASLGLNIALLLALLLPRVGLGVDAEPVERERTREPGGFLLRGVVDDERRAELQPLLEPMRGEVREALRAVRQARRDVDATLRAEPFDVDALGVALAHLRRSEALASEAVHRMMVQVAGELSAEERAKMADRLLRRHWRGGGGRDGAEARGRDRGRPQAPD